MVYKFRNFRPNVSAEVAGQVCERLAQENRLTGKALVEESRPEDAPLHRYFEWDDTKAAELYRERQGRDLIAHLIIEPENVDDEEKEVKVVRAFYNVDETPEYHPIERILTNEDLHQKLLERARTELMIFKGKYETLLELGSVISAIDEFMKGVFVT